MSKNRIKYQVIASDFNSPFIRNYLWNSAFFKYPKMFGLPRPVFAIASRSNRINYYTDLSTWSKTHEALKSRALKDGKIVNWFISQTAEFGEEMNRWSQKQIFDKDLAKLSNCQLYRLLLEFMDKESTEYAYGVSLPILDFQSFSYVEGNLKKYLKARVSAGDYDHYFRILTEPDHDSFAQDQEIALLKLASKFYARKKWRQEVAKYDLAELQKRQPIFCRLLAAHAKKYGWVYYVYTGPAFGPEQFLDFIKIELEKKVDPKKRLAQIKLKKSKNKEVKRRLLLKLKPDKFNANILKLAGLMVWAKPRRKDYQSKTYYHAEKLFKEIGRRLFLSIDQVRSCLLEDLKAGLLAGRPVDTAKINSIFNLHVCVPKDNGQIAVLLGKQAEAFIKKYQSRQAKVSGKLRSLFGACAFPGKAKGVVKIINSPADLPKMKKGDILVSPATTPSIVSAMKKAAAIVTDEGGLTCHASIVSRELEIPCVVGAKIATRVFKDGDRVEVDAGRGVIKRI